MKNISDESVCVECTKHFPLNNWVEYTGLSDGFC